MSAAQLELAADILGPLLPDVVFVGGATIHLWITEPAAPPVRATDDVDVICDITTRVDYYKLGERLRERDLRETPDEPVICRWRHRESQLAIDVMPIAEEVLGFTNEWYELAIATAVDRTLASGKVIRAANPPAIVATKLAAWRGRGRGDVLASLDLHDVIALIDGRPELSGELGAARTDLGAFVASELHALRSEPLFDYLLQAAVSGYGPVAEPRAVFVRARIADVLRELSA
jgi:hypothetical protein